MAGKEPRTKLRRVLKEGLKQDLEVQVGIDTGVGASPAPPALGVRYILTLQTKTRTPAGSETTVDVVLLGEEVLGTSLKPEVVQANQEANALLSGSRANYTIREDGFADPIRFDVSQKLSGRLSLLEQALRDLVLILPDEEIGEGAQWTVVETIQEGQDEILQRTTYELTKIDGPVIDVRTRVEQADVSGTARPGTVAFPPIGNGKARWDLTKLAPLSSQRKTTQRMIVYGEGEQTPISTIRVAKLSAR